MICLNDSVEFERTAAMKTRWTGLLLALILLLLPACGQGGEDTPETAAADGAPDPGTEETAEETERTPYIETCDYQGAEVRILTPVSTTSNYLFADEETRDSMNDAVFKRTILTEDYLGIDLTYTAECEIAELQGIVARSVTAGDDEYQIVLADSMRGNTALVSDGSLLDLFRVENIDLSRGYWNQDAPKKLTVNGKLFFTKSKYVIPSVGVVTFNKHMIEDYGLTSPYEAVRNGTWTLDEFIGDIRKGSSDLNGDGKMTIDDQYGLVCMSDWPLDCMIYAAGINITALNAEGRMELSILSERAITLYEKLYDLINVGDDTFHWAWGTAAEKTITMASDRALFELRRSNALHELRDSEIDFGIVPYPKFDEAQAGYSINDYSRNICIPVTAADPGMVGKTLEMLAYYSDLFVYSTYYDGLLTGKVVRDTESIEMLEIISDSVVFDGGMTYFGLNGGSMQSIMYFISTKICQGNGDFASFYAKTEKTANKEIDKFYDSIGG